MVSEQNPHIIAMGIENTININFAAVSAIKADVISAYNKAIIALYLRNRRQRSPCLCISLQNAETLCNSTYGCQCYGWVQQLFLNIGFDFNEFKKRFNSDTSKKGCVQLIPTKYSHDGFFIAVFENIIK